jgi:hypothetical protein
LLAASIFSTVSLSSFTKGWPSRVISPRNLLMPPSTILATISGGLPDSFARASMMVRSPAIASGETWSFERNRGLAKAMCIATSLPTASCPSNSTITPIFTPCT